MKNYITVILIVFIAGVFYCVNNTTGRSYATSQFVTCYSECEGGFKIKSGSVKNSLFPLTYCVGYQSTTTLEVNASQSNAFEILIDYVKNNSVDKEFVRLIESIRSSAIKNDYPSYKIQVDKFDQYWFSLPNHVKDKVLHTLSREQN